MCSMIYDQPHHQQLDMTMMASSSDKTSPSFGVGIGQTTTVRQPSVGLAVPVNTGKENGGNCIGVPAGNVPASAASGVESIVDDGELRLEVTCGQNQAFLYTGRLQLGSKGTCVLFENAWLTPNEFQYVSGRETAKDWKRSIKHHGKSLKVLIAKGILTTSPPARCDCGQCNSSPRKPNSGSDCAVFAAPSSVDCPKLSTTDCSEAWRSGVHGAPTTDGTPATSGSAFRPPLDGASSTGAYRNPDCALAGDLSTVSDDAFGSRSMSKSSHHQQSSVEQSHSGSITSSSSSPDVRSKKSSSSGVAKRQRSPSADSSLDHPPSKHQLLDGSGGHHSSESSTGRGEHQSRLGYESSSSRSHQRQQFSPSADTGSQRRRDQSQTSSSSNGQCRSSQSGSFKSPSVPAHHHHYQNGGSGSQQHASSSQKSSPTTGITASTGGMDRSHVGLSSDPSCVISPLAATPYFPFLAAAAAATSTAAQLPTTPVCYPNPYMMLPLAAAAAAYQNPSAAQFPSPYGWNSAAVSVASSVAEASRLTSGNMSIASNGPAFDFPWMRGGGCASQTAASNGYAASKLSPTPPSMMGDPYELAKQSSTFGMGSASQNPYAYRGSSGSAAAAAGFGGLFAAAADQLDAYDNYLRSSFKVATPHLTSAAAAAAAGFQQSLFDGQHNAAAAAAGFGVYNPLFQSPYFGIPSR